VGAEAPSSPWTSVVPVSAIFQDVPALRALSDGSQRHWWAANMITVAWGTAADPLTTLRLPASWGWPAQTIQMHVPASTAPPGTSDNTITFVDTVSGRVVDIWQAVKAADGSWSGPSAALCTLTDSGWGTPPGLGAGIRAVGCSNLGGLITAQDLTAAKIAHALALVLPMELIAPGFVPPAIATDGGGMNGPVKEGQRLGIPASTPKPAMHTPEGPMMWDALVTYGAFVVDNSGGSVNPVFQFATGVTLQPNLTWPLPNDVDLIGQAIRVVS
jgi:hypothetical protein